MSEVDRLSVVLDASTEEFERDMDSASEATKEFGDAGSQAALKNIELLTSLEAITGSLGQITGGYAKTTAAAQQLGLINEEQYAQFEKARYGMELLIGPIEATIAATKIMSASRILHTNIMA